MKLGQLNVDAVLRRLTAKQFLEWEEYARLEPFDVTDRRQDWRAAQIVKQVFDSNQRLISALCALHGLERHKRPRFIEVEMKDFVLSWNTGEETPKSDKKKKQSWQEQWAIVEMINTAFGGTRH